MLFNSFSYALFLPLVFLLYWFVFNRSLKIQNAFLLLAGYVFYGWWDWRFLILIAFSTAFDFMAGIWLEKEQAARRRKLIFICSCIVNLGFLGFFKYYNFFVESFSALVGDHGSLVPLQIILPVGISFYTFQSLSYTADIYFRKTGATKDLILFATYISFFPQLVAGPIERAGHLLPQFASSRIFNPAQARSGLREMLWGFFKKIVIADSLAGYADVIFSNSQTLPGSTLLLGAIYFGVQIYCDFSGYSSIARGTAKLFGFELMQNFNFPYFARSPVEFWRRWHISLSTWFRDYVYIPLGGSRVSKARAVRNILIVFALSGLWHGASWNFVAWGLVNGLLLIPSLFAPSRSGVEEPGLRHLPNMLLTFLLINLSWIYFRSPDMASAHTYFQNLFTPSLFSWPVQHGLALTVPLILILFIAEWFMMKGRIRFEDSARPVYLRWSLYLLLALTCLSFFRQDQSFIYFQF